MMLVASRSPSRGHSEDLEGLRAIFQLIEKGGELSSKSLEDELNELELDRVFPTAEALIQKMDLDVSYKDVTFETLNREDFLQAIRAAFEKIDWDKAYEEFRAAGEKKN